MKRRTIFLLLLALPAFAFVVVPLIGLFANTRLDSICPLINCPEVKSALFLSVTTSGISAVMIILLGTPLAYALAHGRFRGKRMIDAVVDLPIVLPPAVAGVALFLTFGRNGLVGRHFAPYFTIPFTTLAVILAQVFVACPLYVRQAKVGFLAVPNQLVRASRTLGASPLRTFLRITLPLASHGLIAGIVLAWARAVGEFGATLMFAGNMQGVTQTMPLAIYAAFEAKDKMPSVIVMSGILVATSFLVIIATKVLLEARGRGEAEALV
jgi:molybdate transport system permease protein